MILRTDLEHLAKARLADAEVLLANGRFDAAVYLCGYAVETALKARICTTLSWSAFPDKRPEFRSFAVHKLETLLTLSGIEATVKNNCWADWSYVDKWNSELRYQPVGTSNQADAEDMILAADYLLKVLL